MRTISPGRVSNQMLHTFIVTTHYSYNTVAQVKWKREKEDQLVEL